MLGCHCCSCDRVTTPVIPNCSWHSANNCSRNVFDGFCWAATSATLKFSLAAGDGRRSQWYGCGGGRAHVDQDCSRLLASLSLRRGVGSGRRGGGCGRWRRGNGSGRRVEDSGWGRVGGGWRGRDECDVSVVIHCSSHTAFIL